MAKIRGIGGVFFKSQNAEALRAWYAKHLGIESGPEGKMFAWRDKDDPSQENVTVWSIFPASSNYFNPSKSPLMMNYIVDDLNAMLADLKASGVPVADKVEEHEYGKFGWVFDPDGNKIELWEPPNE